MSLFPLQTRHLTKNYGNQTVIHDVNLAVPEGALYGLLGPNGAGKTTTLYCLLGLSTPTQGQCLIQNQDSRQPQARSNVAGMIHNPAYYPNLTARENMQIISGLRQKNTSDHTELLELVQLETVANRPVHTYSLGMRQRLGIALTLIGQPQNLILDEPQNGLDPQGIQEMRSLLRTLKAREHTMIVSSHLLTEIQHIATHLGVMHQGKLVFQGSIEEFKADTEDSLILYIEDPINAFQVLKKASLPVQLKKDKLYLPIHIQQKQVAQILIEAGLNWNRLEQSHHGLEEHYFALTGEKT